MALKVEGKVESGMGRGKLFVEMAHYRRAFGKVLGEQPFPGTLNVKASPEETGFLRKRAMERIEGFLDGDRTYGGLSLISCAVNGVPGAAVFPDRATHEPGVIEIVSGENLRERLGLKDGDSVKIGALE